VLESFACGLFEYGSVYNVEEFFQAVMIWQSYRKIFRQASKVIFKKILHSIMQFST